MDPILPKSPTRLTLDDLIGLSNAQALPPWVGLPGPAFRALVAVVHAAGGPRDASDPTLLAMLERVRVRPDGLYADGMFALWLLEVIGDTIEKVDDSGVIAPAFKATIKPDSRSGSKREVTAYAPAAPPPGSLWRTNWTLAARAAIAIEWLLQERTARVSPFRFVVDFLELEQRDHVAGPTPAPKYQDGGVVGPAQVPIFGDDEKKEAAPLPRRMAHARILEVDTAGIAGVLNRLLGKDLVHAENLSVTIRRRPKFDWRWWLKVATLELYTFTGTGYHLVHKWSLEQWDAAADAVGAPPPPLTTAPPVAITQTEFENAADAAAALEEAAEEDAEAGGPLDPRVGGELPEVMRVPSFHHGFALLHEKVGDAPSRRETMKEGDSLLLAIEDTGLFCIVTRDTCTTPTPIMDATPPGTARAWLKFRMAELGYSAPMIEDTIKQTATMLPTEIADLANTLATVKK